MMPPAAPRPTMRPSNWVSCLHCTADGNVMDYRREIDGLRAVAVLPVILFHAGFQTFSGGFVGVDVFFVISGYLITTIILAELAKGKFSILDFYERRARRILPALFLVMFVCLPFAWLWLLPQEMENFSKSLIAVSTFVSNIFFGRNSGYFEPATELQPLLHTWSLAVEEQYYVFFPIFLILVGRFDKRWTLGLLIAFFVVSLTSAQWMSVGKQTKTFYLLYTRGWELLVGVFVALHFLNEERKLSPKPLNEVGAFIGLASIMYAIFVFDKSTPFPSLYTLIPTVGSALIILCATQSTYVGKLLGNKAFVGVGLISYSAYLWHQPIFAFAKQRIFDGPNKIVLVGLILLTIVLAYLSWKFVERPFREKSRYGRKSVFVIAAMGTVFFVFFGLIGQSTKGFPNRAIAEKFQAFDYDTIRLGYKRCDDALLTAGVRLNYCLQATRGDVNAVLIGDSHANDKFFGIAKNIPDLNWALVGNSSCPPVLGVNVQGKNYNCRIKFEKILNWIGSNENIHTVVLSYYGSYALTTAYSADHLRNHLGPDTIKIEGVEASNLGRSELFYYGLSRTVRELMNAKKRVIVLTDIPELPFFPIDCVRGRPKCTVELSEVLSRQSEHRNSLHRLKEDFPEVSIYDPLGIFCSEQSCTYKRDDLVLYQDSHHLTFNGSNVYGSDFSKWFYDLQK